MLRESPSTGEQQACLKLYAAIEEAVGLFYGAVPVRPPRGGLNARRDWIIRARRLLRQARAAAGNARRATRGLPLESPEHNFVRRASALVANLAVSRAEPLIAAVEDDRTYAEFPHQEIILPARHEEAAAILANVNQWANNVAATNERDANHRRTRPASKHKSGPRKRFDPLKDRRLVEDWQSAGHPLKAAFERDRGLPPGAISAAQNRLRHQ